MWFHRDSFFRKFREVCSHLPHDFIVSKFAYKCGLDEKKAEEVEAMNEAQRVGRINGGKTSGELHKLASAMAINEE